MATMVMGAINELMRQFSRSSVDDRHLVVVAADKDAERARRSSLDLDNDCGNVADDPEAMMVAEAAAAAAAGTGTGAGASVGAGATATEEMSEEDKTRIVNAVVAVGSMLAETLVTSEIVTGAAVAAAAPEMTAPVTAAAPAVVVAEAVAVAVEEPMEECKLCGEQVCVVDLKAVGLESPWEQWHKETLCAHKACEGCLKKWLEVKVEEGTIYIRCPFPDCRFHFYSDDIQRLAEPAVYQAFQGKVAEVYERREAEVMADDEMKEYLDLNARRCPHCHVIIERYDGCNYMVCTCGKEFCYGCGKTYDGEDPCEGNC